MTAGKGYRLLKVGEKIRKTDEHWDMYTKRWHLTCSSRFKMGI